MALADSKSVRLSIICDAISQSHYSNQLLTKTSCISYGSPQLKMLWSHSVDFLNFSILTLTCVCHVISQKPLFLSTSN